MGGIQREQTEEEAAVRASLLEARKASQGASPLRNPSNTGHRKDGRNPIALVKAAGEKERNCHYPENSLDANERNGLFNSKDGCVIKKKTKRDNLTPSGCKASQREK